MFVCSEVSDLPWESKTLMLSLGLSATGLTLSPIIFLLNAMVITTLKKRRELHKNSYILLLSMAIADLLTGVIFIPLWVVVVLLILRQFSLERVCAFQAINTNLAACFLFSSLYHLAVVAWERYIAIQKWRDYKIIATKARLKYFAKLAWLAAVATTFPALIMDFVGVHKNFLKSWIIFGNFCGAATIVGIIYCYIMIYRETRKRRTSEINQVTATVQRKLQSKIAKTTSLITAALLCTLFLAGVLFSLRAAFPAFRTDLPLEILGILFQLNSAINPLIYCYRDRLLKKAVLELLRIKKPQRIQPATGESVQFRRRRSRFGSMANGQRNLTPDENCTRSRQTRSASYCVLRDQPKPCEMLRLKRSPSDPVLVKFSNIS